MYSAHSRGSLWLHIYCNVEQAEFTATVHSVAFGQSSQAFSAGQSRPRTRYRQPGGQMRQRRVLDTYSSLATRQATWRLDPPTPRRSHCHPPSIGHAHRAKSPPHQPRGLVNSRFRRKQHVASTRNKRQLAHSSRQAHPFLPSQSANPALTVRPRYSVSACILTCLNTPFFSLARALTQPTTLSPSESHPIELGWPVNERGADGTSLAQTKCRRRRACPRPRRRA
jgi:hypothetical protein